MLGVFVAGGYLAWVLAVPRIVRGKVAGALESAGFSPVSMDLPRVGVGSTTISNISAGLPPRLTVGRVEASYSARRLLAGGVNRIDVDHVRLSLPTGAGTSATAAPAAQPPAAGSDARPAFDALVVRDAQIDIATPAGHVTVPVEASAVADQNRQIHVSVTGSVGQTVIAASAVSSARFDKVDWQVSATGLSIDLARPWLPPGLPPIAAENIDLTATGQFTAANSVAMDLQSLIVRAPQITVGAADNGVLVKGLELSTSAKGNTAPTGWEAELGADSTIKADVVWRSGASPVPVKLQLAACQFAGGAGLWHAHGEGASLSAASARVRLMPWNLDKAESGLTGKLSLSLAPLDLKQIVARDEIARIMQQWRVQGMLSGDADLVFDQGQMRPRATIQLSGASLVNKDYQLSVEDIAGKLTVTRFWPIRTEPDERLTFAYAQMGKWELRDALATFCLPGDGTVSIQSARLGWAGGELWCSPFTMPLTAPVVRTTLGAKDLDLGKIVWVLSAEKASAEGKADLLMPVDFSWPQLRFGKGWAEARSGGVLHLTDTAQKVEQWLTTADPRFVTDPTYSKVRERIVQSLQHFKLQKFRAEFDRADDHLLTTLTIQGAGNSENSQALNLNLTANDLDWLLSRYLALQRKE